MAILNRCFSFVARLFLTFYQVHLSGIFGGVCRFQPSCSCYAQQAFNRYPPCYALVLTVRRLLRCHPWGAMGDDPLPENFTLRREPKGLTKGLAKDLMTANQPRTS